MKKLKKFIILIICFIFIYLSFANKPVFAEDNIVYRAKRGYGDEASLYTDKFNVTYTLIPNGNTASIKVNGTMGTQSNPYEVQSMDYTYSFNFYDTDYDYIPFVYHDYNVRYIMYFKVPHGSTYYAFNYGNNNHYTSFFCGFYCNMAYEVYEKNTRVSSKAAGSIYHSNLIGAYPLCLTYDKVTKDNVLYNPFGQSLINATFLNAEDQNYSNTLDTGEFTYFSFTITSGGEPYFPMWIYFHDTTDFSPPSYDYVNDQTSFYLDLNDYTYSATAIYNGVARIYFGYTRDGLDYYFVPCVNFPCGYKNGHSYQLDLLWSPDYGTTVEHKTFTWTTNFTAAGIAKQDENQNDKTLSDREKYLNYLTNGDLNNEIINLPTFNYSDMTFGLFSNIIVTITDAFYDATDDETITFSLMGIDYTLHSTFFDVLSVAGLSVLKTFLGAAFAFMMGYWVYLDLRKRIYYLREFHWTLMFADDISVNML